VRAELGIVTVHVQAPAPVLVKLKFSTWALPSESYTVTGVDKEASPTPTVAPASRLVISCTELVAWEG